MLKLLVKFGKVVLLLTLMIVLNPHRAVLIPFSLLAAFGSWLAWRLEDACQWIAEKVNVAKKKFWLAGRPIGDKIEKEVEELHRMILDMDRKLKAG